ncbi:unnamed protein product, partial [Polarella glacialis]
LYPLAATDLTYSVKHLAAEASLTSFERAMNPDATESVRLMVLEKAPRTLPKRSYIQPLTRPTDR